MSAVKTRSATFGFVLLCALAPVLTGLRPVKADKPPEEQDADEEQDTEIDLTSLSTEQTCQVLSDQLAISEQDPGFGPPEVHAWWKNHHCTTKPVESDPCQLASDRFAVAAYNPDSIEFDRAVAWVERQGCEANPEYEDPCQALSDRFALDAKSWGCASPSIRDLWDKHACKTRPATVNGCRLVGELLGKSVDTTHLVLSPDVLARVQEGLLCRADHISDVVLYLEQEHNPDHVVLIAPRRVSRLAAPGEVITVTAISSAGNKLVELERSTLRPRIGSGEGFVPVGDRAALFAILMSADRLKFESALSCWELRRVEEASGGEGSGYAALYKMPPNVRFQR